MFSHQTSIRVRRMVVLLWSVILVTNFIAAQPVTAATFDLTSCDADPLLNGAALNAAIVTANANNADDTINLGTCTYSLTSTITIGDDSGHTLSINGISSASTTLSGNDTVRVFVITAGAEVTVRNVTIRDGHGQAELDILTGGGIENSGTLTVENSSFVSNIATFGAGIANLEGSSLTVTDSSFAENSASSGNGIFGSLNTTITVTGSLFENHTSGSNGGGAIFSAATLDVAQSIFRNNESAGGGGAVSITNGSISSSIFEDNTSTALGGGLYATGTISVTNTVFANNLGFVGGAIYSSGATLTVANTTMSGGLALGGAGIFVNGGTVMLNNTLIANNTGGDCTLNGGTVNAQHSLIEEGLGCVNGVNTNNLTGDPALNGDSTLSSSSIAIDAGSNSLIPAGLTTDVGGNDRIRGLRVDMGAYESPYPLTTLAIQLVLQARPAAPNAAYMVSGEVELRPTTGVSPIIAATFTADNMGRFIVNDLSLGTYDVWVKGSHTLARLHENVVIALGENALTAALLIEGDADDNNVINILDFSVLSTAYGTSTGDVDYDARADFNMDGMISLTDFSLLASNFGGEGD